MSKEYRADTRCKLKAKGIESSRLIQFYETPCGASLRIERSLEGKYIEGSWIKLIDGQTVVV